MFAALLTCLTTLTQVNPVEATKKPDSPAIAALKKNGAEFRPRPYYRFVVDEDDQPEDAGGVFVSIGECWKGTPDELSRLANLRTLKEVSFTHDDLGNDSCAGLELLPDLRGLFFMGPRFSDKGIARFKGLNSLEALGLRGTSVTDEGLKVVGTFKKLRWLKLTQTKVTDKGLQSLQNLTNLEGLYLGSTKTSGAGIRHLHALTKLRRLELSGELAAKEKGNSGLAFLSSMTNLEEITSAYPLNLVDEEFRGLSKLNKLKQLALPFSPVTDKALSHLACLESLEDLDLSYSMLSDKAGPTLATLKSLRRLDIDGTNVTDAIIPHLLSLPKFKTLLVDGSNLSEKGKKTLEAKGIYVSR